MANDESTLWVGVGGKSRHVIKGQTAAAPSRADVSTSSVKGSPIGDFTRTDGQQLCARLLAYVMERELGGRHQAISADQAQVGDEDEDLATQLQLEVELARPTNAALSCACSYLVRYDEAGGGDAVRSSATYTRVANDVALFRKSLHTCWASIDLVGGLTDGMTEALRSTSQNLVRSGLRGQLPAKRPREVVHQLPRLEAEKDVTGSLLSLLQDSDDEAV